MNAPLDRLRDATSSHPRIAIGVPAVLVIVWIVGWRFVVRSLLISASLASFAFAVYFFVKSVRATDSKVGRSGRFKSGGALLAGVVAWLAMPDGGSTQQAVSVTETTPSELTIVDKSSVIGEGGSPQVSVLALPTPKSTEKPLVDDEDTTPKKRARSAAEEKVDLYARKLKDMPVVQSLLCDTVFDAYFKTMDYRPPSSFRLLPMSRVKRPIIDELESTIANDFYESDFRSAGEFLIELGDEIDSLSSAKLNKLMTKHEGIQLLVRKIDQVHLTLSIAR